MTNIVVQNSSGYGVLLLQSIGSSSITNCRFHSNVAIKKICSSGGNALLVYRKCAGFSELSIEKAFFYDGESRNGVASGLIILLLNDACVNLSLSETIMMNNNSSILLPDYTKKKVFGGNMAVINSNSSTASLVITNCNGKAVLGGGIFVYYLASQGYGKWMTLEKCFFVENTAYTMEGELISDIKDTPSLHHFSEYIYEESLDGTGGVAIVVEYLLGINHYSSAASIVDCSITDSVRSMRSKVDPSLIIF